MRTHSRIGRPFLLILAIASLAAGCTSQERLTAKATPCTTKEVSIQQSAFSRNGSTTAWCAECKGKLYQCATTTERTHVECHVAREYDICR